MRPTLTFLLPAVVAMYMPFCAAEIRQTVVPPAAPPVTLWEAPADLSNADLFNGPWGAGRAPDPQAEYTFLRAKRGGINPGMTVRDPAGRQWSVKQGRMEGWADEGPVEVVLSRILSAVGYHQPPVYYLPGFTVIVDGKPRSERGGRFRLSDETLKDVGTWSWQQNPFVGTKPYQGLLVILLLFNGTDLKNSNNTLYEHRAGGQVRLWYTVRDIGAALGTTGRFAPEKGNPEAFERSAFITGVRGGFVEFAYSGWHQELLDGRITPDDVRWASELLAGLSERQWQDAFRAGGYAPEAAERFIATVRRRIAEGQRLAAS